MYFANRANAKLEIHDYLGTVEDCDWAIDIDPKYTKSYLRKAKTLILIMKFRAGLEAVNIGLELDPDNVDFKDI